MRRNVITALGLGALMLLAAAPVGAVELATSRVTVVEATYMPNAVTFMMETGTASCPAGHWLKWQKSADSNKAVYAALMTAVATGKKISFYVNDGDTSCVGVFFHLVN